MATRSDSLKRIPWLVAIATAVIFACTTDTLIGPKDVAVLVIEPDTVVMPVGDTILLEGVATDSRGVKYIGEKTVLSSFHAKKLPVAWGEPSGDFMHNDEWEPRKVWIIEGISKLPQYAYSKRVMYLD